ncbi:unannotated protein [freshwater metagenome]|uniref:Unannotated protein n=1 Tax=freshwater metagenome TaxID=449393 RepID=A0A6J6LJ27_9ZZZZ
MVIFKVPSGALATGGITLAVRLKALCRVPECPPTSELLIIRVQSPESVQQLVAMLPISIYDGG